MKHKVFTLFLLFWSLQIYAQQNSSKQSWMVPFQLYKNFLVVVEGSIGDLNGLNLLIDTGTNPTIVDARVTRKLHLNGYKSSLPVVTGTMESSELLIPSIAIGPVLRPALRVAVGNLSGLEESLGVRIDALVGLDVLGSQNFLIDYENHTITFGNTRGERGSSTSFQSEPPFVTVAMRMNQQPVNLLVDTGSPELVLFEKNIAESLRSLDGVNRSSSNLNGAISLREIEVGDTRLGESALGARRVYVASDRNPHFGFDGLLGVAALGVRQVAFDFEHRLFTWQTQEAIAPAPLQSNRLDRCRPEISTPCIRNSCGCTGISPSNANAYGHFRSNK